MDEQIKGAIQNHIDENDVCLFMKGTPDAPQCGFSMAVTNLLKILEVNFKGINVLEDQNLREGIKVFSDWPTIPQLYIKKEFVGGCDIVKEMYENVAATWAANGVDLREPRKPEPPAVAQLRVLPWRSVIVMMVLLKDA